MFEEYNLTNMYFQLSVVDELLGNPACDLFSSYSSFLFIQVALDISCSQTGL